MKILPYLLACLIFVAGVVIADSRARVAEAGVVVLQNENITEVDMQNVIDDGNVSTIAVSSMAVQARYENVKYGYNKTLAAMDVVISYLGDKTNVSVLEDLKENFTSLFTGLEAYVLINDPSGFGKQVAEMHKVAARFKSETAKLADPQNIGQIRNRIQDRLRQFENETAMERVRERVRILKANVYKFACGINIIRIHKLRQNLIAQNISADELQNITVKMEEICRNLSANRTDFEPAISRIKDLFSDAKTVVVAQVKLANERALDRAIKVINALENRGININAAQERLTEIQALRNEIRETCANLTSGKCIEKIKELGNETQALRNTVRIIVRENASGTGVRARR